MCSSFWSSTSAAFVAAVISVQLVERTIGDPEHSNAGSHHKYRKAIRLFLKVLIIGMFVAASFVAHAGAIGENQPLVCVVVSNNVMLTSISHVFVCADRNSIIVDSVVGLQYSLGVRQG